jgi:hypothetical protein
MNRILGILGAIAGLVLAGCEGMPQQVAPSYSILAGYTCCNLHYENDWISDVNWSSMPMIPAGASIKVLEYGRYRIMTEIDGRKMRLGLDYGRSQPLEEWARKLVVKEDPRPEIARWPAPVREAVRAGKVAIGMSKEEVIVSLGYPPAHETPSLDRPQWKYWHTSFGSYLVVWDGAGRVKDVITDAQTRLLVVYERGR